MVIPSNPGKPAPLGVSSSSSGEFNFALFSSHAERIDLSIFDSKKALLCLKPLNPDVNKTGNIWHIQLDLPPVAVYYAYQIQGPAEGNFFYRFDQYLLDPYARAISTGIRWGTGSTYHPLGVLSLSENFDWQQVGKPYLEKSDLLIYEMHVRGFTVHSSSKAKYPGSFLGVIDKIPYLLELGVNAIELLPLQEFDENEVHRNERMRDLVNYWGYSTVNFFSPMNRYAVSSSIGAAIQEFKTMVRELHRHGIEVILDVVFNHTAEGNEAGPIISFKGIDAPIYYLYDENGNLRNYSGCGNTFNCNHPVARQLIIDSLRYWALEMRVDGFRFDLASILQRGKDGEPLSYSPLIDEITEDPVLAEVKLIAEPWDAVGLYHVGSFVPQNKRWMEWNDKYRDVVRKFIKGTPEKNIKGNFITRICGSDDLYGKRTPLSSLNFITAHDGFSLRDLVSYNTKHNEANEEDNKDGISNNESWNCGAEGPTEDPDILFLREKQMRNFHLALMISQGVPMILMGDEYGHTRLGNNNTWCQDNELNWFLWDEIHNNSAFFRFYKKMIGFRKSHPILRRDSFLTSTDILWHGLEPLKPEWDSELRLVAFTLIDEKEGKDLYILFNSDNSEHKVILPAPRENSNWYWMVNTANTSPDDFFDEESAPCQISLEIDVAPYSACILIISKNVSEIR
jgi:isoamylase